VKIIIAGATGFIGTALVERLVAGGHVVSTLSRDPTQVRGKLQGASCLRWDARSLDDTARTAVGEADAVINLAGASVGDKRWSAKFKEVIRASRIESTRTLVDAMLAARRPGAVYVGSSGSGYYGDTGDAEVTEESPPGEDFLATVCRDWEAEAMRAAEAGARVVRIRPGLVLGKDGGPLLRMATPFRMGVGGPLGSGRQWVPWIHLDDVIGLIELALGTPHAQGPVNATAPDPVTMKQFAQALGKALHRPAFMKVPGFALRAILGPFAEALLTGQKVLPRVAEKWGYRFRHPTLEGALAAIFA
jgi:uncharacterized protein (TIGR01777 family)